MNSKETLDPDYAPAFTEKNTSKVSLNVQQQESKELTVKKIKNIVRNQFALEMKLKEQEIETIDNNIRQTRHALDRIRACVLARYYGMTEVSNTPANLAWPKPRRSRREAACKRLDRKPSRNSLSTTSGSAMSALKKPSDTGKVDNKKSYMNALDCTTSFTSEIQTPTLLADYDMADENEKSSKPNCFKSNNLLPGNLNETRSVNVKTETLSSSHKSMEADQREKLTTVQSSTSINILPGCSKDYCLEQSDSSKTGSKFSLASLAAEKVKDVADKQPSLSNAKIADNTTQMNRFVSKLDSNNPPKTQSCGSGSRFYVKKRVIIGNTSKYIPPDRREEKDKSTHKWMVYVRGPPGDPNIETYVKKVWFFLHPSYRPNDIVEINKPPFHLTRRGWGEFPIRVQLHFVGSWNKRVDIIHELKLDKTYTGLQTLGAETVVDLEIDRKTFEDLGIPVPLDSQITQDDPLIDGTVTASATNEEKSKREFPLENLEEKAKHSAVLNDTQVNKIQLETLSTLSSPSVSRTGSGCNSPVHFSKGSFTDAALQKQLHFFADRIPLISSQKDVYHAFCATSVDQFFSWNVGKRRASEWQHALKIRNKIRSALNSSKITTKEVMIWCRRHGYTPQSNLVTEQNVSYCKVCGRLLDNEKLTAPSKSNLCHCSASTTNSSTLSPALDLLKQVEAKGAQFEIRDSDIEDVEVDVVNLPNSRPAKYPSSNQKHILTTQMTPEEHWVRDVCNEIGVGLRPEVIEGVEVNSVESALFSASKQFMKQLMHTAVALSSDSKSSLDAKLLVPGHISEAIGRLPHFDFLSNAYFGMDA